MLCVNAIYLDVDAHKCALNRCLLLGMRRLTLVLEENKKNEERKQTGDGQRHGNENEKHHFNS